MNNEQKHIMETSYYPLEIPIEGAGSIVKFTHALPLLYEKVEGVTVLHPGGNHGNGTLELGVAGEEIFPEGFHARSYMCIHGSHYQDAMINKELDCYMYEFHERAKGSTVQVRYTEPSDGEGGILYLVFKLSRQRQK